MKLFNFILKIKQKFCSHEFLLSTMTARDDFGKVHNVCLKCKKILIANYGLAFDGKFVLDKFNNKETNETI